MENIIPIERLAELNEQIVKEIARGLTAASKFGVVVRMPKEIQVTATVIITDGFQSLQLKGGDSTETLEEQGGSNTETSTDNSRTDTGSTRKTTENQTGTEHVGTENAHNQESTETREFRDV